MCEAVAVQLVRRLDTSEMPARVLGHRRTKVSTLPLSCSSGSGPRSVPGFT